MKSILFIPILFLMSCSNSPDAPNSNISIPSDSLVKKDTSHRSKPGKISDDMILGFKFEMTKKEFNENLKRLNARQYIGHWFTETSIDKMFATTLDNGKYSAPTEVYYSFNKKRKLNYLFLKIYHHQLPSTVQANSVASIEREYAEFVALTQNINYQVWQDPKNEVLDSYNWDDGEKQITVNVDEQLNYSKRSFTICFSDKTLEDEMTWLKK